MGIAKGTRIKYNLEKSIHHGQTGVVTAAKQYSLTRWKYAINWDNDETLMGIGGLIVDDLILKLTKDS